MTYKEIYRLIDTYGGSMTEQIYNSLWNFTKEHKDYHGENGEPQVVAILSLYQEFSDVPIKLKTAADIEEACHCIRMALQYAY